MIQIVRDLAPNARFAFHTGLLSNATVAHGIIELATQIRADIIVDDIVVLDEPFYQDSIIAQAIDRVTEMGVAYFSAAGNEARQSWEVEDGFVPSGQSVSGGGIAHDFDPDPDRVNFGQAIGIRGPTQLSFQWDQPFASASTDGTGSASDIDVFLVGQDGKILDRGADANIAGDALERLEVQEGEEFLGFLVIELISDPAPGRMKYVFETEDQVEIAGFARNSSTILCHANAAGAGTVGAAFWRNTPRFAISPPEIEDLSSVGGTPILVDDQGHRLEEPVIRQTTSP